MENKTVPLYKNSASSLPLSEVPGRAHQLEKSCSCKRAAEASKRNSFTPSRSLHPNFPHYYAIHVSFYTGNFQQRSNG